MRNLFNNKFIQQSVYSMSNLSHQEFVEGLIDNLRLNLQAKFLMAFDMSMISVLTNMRGRTLASFQLIFDSATCVNFSIWVHKQVVIDLVEISPGSIISIQV